MTMTGLANAAESHAKAQLLAGVAAAAPGKPFDVGVLITIDPGWHVYWQNPGDSGLPTTVRFTLPDGWRASDLRYPIPTQFTPDNAAINYGYEHEVMLIATIMPPADARTGTNVTITADASWLVCKDVCLPGKQKLDLTLPVAAQPAPGNAELFSTWSARLPVPAKSSGDIVSLGVAGELTEDGSAAAFVIDVRTRHHWDDVQWFPAASDPALKIEDVHAQSETDHAAATFHARVLPGQKLKSETLRSVLAYTDPSGQRHGVTVDVPLRGGGDANP